MRTYEQINERIASGDAVVLTAEEAIALASEKGVAKAAQEVDVVTTGTFGAMCSSGAFLNFGHSDPPIKMTKVWLNGVPAYGGLAAVDAYIGATELRDDLRLDYGGAHVIESLIRGEAVHLRATAYGTDCYPRRDIDTNISLSTINQAYLFNPRNMYQNYAVAVNASNEPMFTYMGKLLPRCGNATYSSAGQLSPLLKDPTLRTIGLGTRIFLGGGVGYVSWEGTQFKTDVPQANGAPAASARTLAVIGDLKGMSDEFVRALSFHGYGTTLALGIGVPIPILDEDVMRSAVLRDDQIMAPVIDYSVRSRNRKPLAQVSYAQLRSGAIELNGREVRTSSLSSYAKARAVALRLKSMIARGEFELTRPVAPMPEAASMKPLDVRTAEEARL